MVALEKALAMRMTHGFDDEGRQFDAQGNLRDWWTAADAKGFKDRARAVVDQFNGYTVNDSLQCAGNGKSHAGQDENIADLGGLKIAYAALDGQPLAGKPRLSSSGFTPEQQFFLSWARIWANTARPEFARQLVLTDPHAPSRWRVNGPLSRRCRSSPTRSVGRPATQWSAPRQRVSRSGRVLLATARHSPAPTRSQRPATGRRTGSGLTRARLRSRTTERRGRLKQKAAGSVVPRASLVRAQ